MFIEQILGFSGVRHERFSRFRPGGIFLSAANQLFGSFSDIKRFQSTDRDYLGWHAHHVVESQDLGRLGAAGRFPPRDGQFCVLIPERAHVGRVNSILRSHNPAGMVVDFQSLKSSYADAYAFVGDYCGGGERAIRRELLAIVDAIFRVAGQPR